MVRFHVLALLALGAAAAQAQPGPPLTIDPSPDTPAQRQMLRSLTECLAQARPGWARNTLAHPYLSEAQAFAASRALSGRDTCLRGGQAEVVFRTSGLVGNLAEHFLRTELNRADFDHVSNVLPSMEPLNASEDFALCVASRNPAAARDLAFSDPGSTAETQAAQQLAVYLDPCFRRNEDHKVDLQSLRALVSTALYRGTTQVLSARN